MNFLLTVIVYLLIAAVLGAGLLMVMKGSPWLLIIGLGAYVILFSKIGCLPKKSH